VDARGDVECPGSVAGPWARYCLDADSQRIGTVCYSRLVPKDEECAKQLAKRTLSNLYNARATWLDLARRRLTAAYGWPVEVTDDEILWKFIALNLERTEQA
jgi:hypothetical protein